MIQPINQREVNQIIDTINRLEEKLLIHMADGSIELAPPQVLSETIAKIAILLQQAVDPLAKMDLDYRKAKAARFNKFIKEGIKKSPAIDQLKFEDDLIEMESAVNRINNYVKRTEQAITTIQSNIKVKTGAAFNNF